MSTIISVSTLTELYSALATAGSGDTIELAGGDYGDVSLVDGRNGQDLKFASNVTIISADVENPASFSSLTLKGAENITLDGITFDYSFSEGDEIYYRPFAVSSSESITIRNSTFDGDVATGVSDVDDGYGYAIGLSVRDSDEVTVENNEFYEFHRGASFSDSSDIVVANNDIHSIRMDGLNFAQIEGASIENNYIHDFRGSEDSSDHSDMIQFWTNGTDSPSTEIIIRNNYLDIGEGSATQSIFMRNDQVDQGLAGTEMFYSDVTIEENTIVNGHAHGITVGETDGLIISNNTILHADGDSPDGTDPDLEIPKITVADISTNVIITNNITSDISGDTDQTGWTVKQNAFVQDQDDTAFGYYGDVFVTSSLEVVDGIHQYRVLEGSIIDNLQAGATSSYEVSATDDLSVQFHITSDEADTSLYSFDASFSVVNGEALPAGAEYIWDFGDGRTATGLETSHSFSQSGVYGVSLTVILADGTSSENTVSMDVDSTDLISLIEGIGFVGHHASSDTQLTDEDVVELGSQGTTLSIDREYVSDVLGQDEFRISSTITSNSTQSAGEVVRLHGSFIIAVTDDGNLDVKLYQDDGDLIRITTNDLVLNDTQEHEVVVSLIDQVVEIRIDGDVVESVDMTGTLASNGTHDLVFGNPWGADNFDGVLSGFEISANESDFLQQAYSVSVDGGPASTKTFIEAASLETVTEPLNDLSDEIDAPLVVDTASTAVPIILTGSGISESIERDKVDHILGEDAFSISFNLSAGSVESTGEVLRLHQSFMVTVTKDGELQTQLFDTEGGRLTLKTSGANLTDDKDYEIEIAYDNNFVEVLVDGVVLSSGEMENPLGDVGSHDLTFGNVWHDQVFDGYLSNFEISSENESYTNVAATPEPDTLTSSWASLANQVDQLENNLNISDVDIFG